MNLVGLARLLVVLVVAFVVVKLAIAILLPLLLLVVVVAVGGGLYLRSASHSDRQRLLRSARRYLGG